MFDPNDIVPEDPPPTRLDRTRTRGITVEVGNVLRARPGVWFRISVHDTRARACSRIQSLRYKLPPGDFNFVTRAIANPDGSDTTVVAVYGVYLVPAPVAPAPKPSTSRPAPPRPTRRP